MAKTALSVCTIADMNANPDDLLVLLAVSRSAKFTTAAQALGLNHTTVSRRIAALEKALGGRVLSRAAGAWELTELGEQAVLAAEQVEAVLGTLGPTGQAPDAIAGVVRMTATDGFSAYIAAPAVARLRRDHPGLSVEVVTMTRRALQQRSGLDIEVVVGVPQVHRAEAIRLGDYRLGMYASRTYLEEHGMPATVAELNQHPLVYFVDSMLQVDDLDAPRRLVPAMLKGRRYGNMVMAGSDVPFGDDPQLRRRLLGGAVPAHLWDDAQVRAFAAGAPVRHDPAPPPSIAP